MKNLFQKINDIQKEIQSVFKGTIVPVTLSKSYTAVSHDDVAALLHMPLANAGIATIVSMTDCKIKEFSSDETYDGVTKTKYSYILS